MKVVVCVSGGGTNLQSLLDAKAAGSLEQAEFIGVIASRDGIYALERAAKAGLPQCVIRRRDFAVQEDYDAAMISCIEGWLAAHDASEEQPLIVLAGFLTKLGSDFCRRFPNNIMNIHPSLLPSFGGAGLYGIKPHIAVLEHGCKLSGATVHLVDEQYDCGPIVAQKAVPVLDDDTAETLQARVMSEAEQQLLPKCVDLFTKGLLELDGRIVRCKTGFSLGNL